MRTQAFGGAAPVAPPGRVPAMPTTVNRRAVLLLCGTTAGFLLLDVHKVSIAIPSIERALHPGPAGIQLIQAAYVFCFAVTLVPAGRVGDAGRRLALTYAGTYLYLAAGVLCAVAPTAGFVIAGRALLGIAAGLLMPQVMGMVQQLFPAAERGRAFGVYGMCVSLVTALGPGLGGLLVTTLGWRGVFVVNVPVGVALLVAAHALLPAVGRDQGGRRRPDVDVVGLAFGGLALVCLLTPFIFTTGRPGDVDARWLALVPAVGLAALFAARGRRRVAAGRSGVIDPALLRIPSFRNGVLVSLTWFAAGPGIALALTLYLQEARGVTPFLAGLLVLPSSATSVLGSWLGGRHVVRLGRVLTGTGMLLVLASALGTVALLHSPLPTAAVLVGIPALQLVQGLGGGLVVSPNHSMTLVDVPAAQGGAAGAIGQLGQRISNSVGVATASTAYYSTIYGVGFTLTDAPASLHRDALDRATAVACLFLCAAVTVVLVDLRRQVRGRSLGRAVVGS
ncbi:MFS transporter [Saccharothrix syringae]|uniref:MFS transporter n=1 Tax=Saccharothrix syringae TaxID=103733 RepID=A0A5Q0H9U0_SACSY|nr:MFS transporter [Saccharothrix syringae]QFZ23007.1 MFS transporter [Saccharothrix syringae]